LSTKYNNSMYVVLLIFGYQTINWFESSIFELL